MCLDSPLLESINPAEGWTHGGATAIVVGDHFFPDIEIGFDNVLVHADVSSYCAMNDIIC